MLAEPEPRLDTTTVAMHAMDGKDSVPDGQIVLPMLDHTRSTIGGCTTCMEMSGSGVWIGPGTTPVRRQPIQLVQLLDLSGYVVVEVTTAAQIMDGALRGEAPSSQKKTPRIPMTIMVSAHV